MASNSKGNSWDDLLTCPVCLENLQSPRTLSCLHSFCTECLDRCRKPHRRDLECPVCKRLTPLTPMGIRGLQVDYRIQQIRDIVSHTGKAAEVNVTSAGAAAEESRICDPCKSQKKSIPAVCHCIQCFILFCEQCMSKHNGNPLFAGHHVVGIMDSSSAETLFCREHQQHPVRYFCKPCHLLMCTICTMGHDPSHLPEALDHGIIVRYRKQLTEAMVSISGKIREVKSKAKCLETLRQSQQSAFFKVQHLIQERAESLRSKVREQELNLLIDTKNRFDSMMHDFGMENMGEMTFYQSSVESLYKDMQQAISGSPQKCLLGFDDLMVRFKSVSDVSMPAPTRVRANKMIRFLPSNDDMSLIIGSLQECNVADEMEDHDVDAGSQSPTTTVDMQVDNSQGRSEANQPTRKRTTFILNAISPVRKDMKLGRIKVVSRGLWGCETMPNQTEQSGSSLTRTIPENVIDVMPQSSKTPDPSVSLSPSSPSLPSSTTCESASVITPGPKLVFKVEQIGGLLGKLMSPSAVAFLPDGNIVVAECEHRLQVFDRLGQNVKVIGWGKVKPQGVVVTPDGSIACTDKKSQTVKLFRYNNDASIISWPTGIFGMPSGIALTPSGNFVVTDVDRRCVTLHSPYGNVISRIVTTDETQFANPVHVAVDKQENIYVSDPQLRCVKVFGKKGTFVRQINLPTGNMLTRSQGLCIDQNGNLAICDQDNHRIAHFSPDGSFISYILTESNGLKYPCNLAMNLSGTAIAVVESHSGFLTPNPHHSVKLFSWNN